jgi:hypothetical protein
LPSSVAFLKDGKTALLTRSGDNQVNVLHIDGTRVIPGKPLEIKDGGPESFGTA